MNQLFQLLLIPFCLFVPFWLFLLWTAFDFPNIHFLVGNLLILVALIYYLKTRKKHDKPGEEPSTFRSLFNVLIIIVLPTCLLFLYFYGNIQAMKQATNPLYRHFQIGDPISDFDGFDLPNVRRLFILNDCLRIFLDRDGNAWQVTAEDWGTVPRGRLGRWLVDHGPKTSDCDRYTLRLAFSLPYHRAWFELRYSPEGRLISKTDLKCSVMD